MRDVTGLTGLRDIPATAYHADEIADRPTLSKSILHTLIERSPAHARAAHPKLNPELERVDDEKFDLGTAAHALFLEGDAGVQVVQANDWRTAAAKEQRDLARADGRIPMLAKHYDDVCQMVAALREQCDEHPAGPFFRDGTAERTLVWDDEYGVLCRARLDWLRDDLAAIDDLKTTRASANPEQWSRSMFGFGADLQVAFYLRGCEKVLGCRPDFRFVVVETVSPFALSVVSLVPDALALAEKKVSYALKVWAMCLRNDVWPGYAPRVAFAEAPPWLEAQWLEREMREVPA